MNKLHFFLVTYDRLIDRTIENLSEDELKNVSCYAVQKSVKKNISLAVKHTINEWELPWNNFEYQTKQYYEYGTFVHLLQNPKLTENLTHIGISHYDTIFEQNSINEIYDILKKNSNTIFYQRIRSIPDLYLTKYELDHICEFMSLKLEMNINSDYIWNNGWVSEALSLTPKNVFLKFANFIYQNKNDVENILIQNKWGIMDNINHRVCGLVERMWGFYLMCCNLEMQKMKVIHDWDFYTHKHQSESNWIQ